MSGPVEDTDRQASDFGISTIEVKEGRSTRIGELGILRVLPTKGRRTVGPWCFVDLMSPDDVERLFRIDKTRSRTGTAGERGSGLGLILCKEMVERHDGELAVESEPGAGSTFRFTVPLAAEAAAQTEEVLAAA